MNDFKFLYLIVVAFLVPMMGSAAEYNLGELARANKLELANRTVDPAKADSPETLFLNSAANDGLAWIPGVEFSEGTIEVEIKGTNQQGRSFVGVAFHGQDNRTFDAVYFRPFNFQATEPERRGHAIQYISMPEHDFNELRNSRPGKYEFAITPSPNPEAWVKLKLIIKGRNVTAFVNDSDKPALAVELLNNLSQGKVGLWVGNGSDGSFKNLKVTPEKD